MNVQVVAKPGQAPDALLGEISDFCAADVSWSGRYYALQNTLNLGRIIDRGIFAADLSRRWQRLVICTPEFAAWWRAHDGEPAPEERIFFGGVMDS